MAARHPAGTDEIGAPREENWKPPELEGWSNAHIYHPLSRRLARALVPTPVTPNMVSVASGLLVVAAGFAYTRLDWPVAVLAGFTAHALWHVVDGADGTLARLTGRASPMGELVDGAADYLSHMFIYWLLAVMLAGEIGFAAYPFVLACGLIRIVQSNHAESQRRIYLWRIRGTPWLKQAFDKGEQEVVERGLVARLFAPLGRAYVALAGTTGTLSAEVDARIARLAHDPAARAEARRLCRERARVPLLLQLWLGANPRTVVLALSMATGSPFWYFFAEMTLFNVLLLWSMVAQRRCDRTLAAELAAIRA